MIREVDIIKSKSYWHRILICQMLSELGCEELDFKPSETREGSCNEQIPKDIMATNICIEDIKRGFRRQRRGEKPYLVLKTFESGSTLRFLLPIMGALGLQGEFLCEGRLGKRPLSPLKEELESHGMIISEDIDRGKVLFAGRLISGTYELSGGVSSQFFTGLLLAMPLLKGRSRIKILGKLESKDYVNITLDVLKKFGIEVGVEADGEQYKAFYIDGNQSFIQPKDIEIEGDWSNASYWIAMGLISDAEMYIRGLNPRSVQGDRSFFEIVRKMGGNCYFEDNTLVVKRSHLKGIMVDGSMIPDVVPTLAALGLWASGIMTLENIGRLRLKESDRILSTAKTIKSLGGHVKWGDDYIKIYGQEDFSPKPLQGGICNSFNDHRIVMLASCLSLISKEKVIIEGSKAVGKSYPNFFEEMKRLGLMENIVEKE